MSINIWRRFKNQIKEMQNNKFPMKIRGFTKKKITNNDSILVSLSWFIHISDQLKIQFVDGIKQIADKAKVIGNDDTGDVNCFSGKTYSRNFQ